MMELKKQLVVGMLVGTFSGLIVLLGENISNSIISLVGLKNSLLLTTSFILLIMTILILIIAFYKSDKKKME